MNTKEKENGSETRTKSYAIAGIVAIAIALIAAMMVTPVVAATTRTVCAVDCDYTNIQDALDASSDGDTVFVYNGTYTGLYKINKPNVTLKGEGVDEVALHGTGGDSIIAIGPDSTAPGCIVEGFTINETSSDLGVCVFSTAPNCTVRNNVFNGLHYGIDTSALNTTITSNVISNMTWPAVKVGTAVGGASNSTVSNNIISNIASYGGIYLRYDTQNCLIVNNTIINVSGGAGIYIRSDDPANNIVTRNNISGCQKGFRLRDVGSGNEIYLNNIIDNVVSVEYSGTVPSQFWNSTEQTEYVYDSTTYTNYLGNYWSPQYTGTDADADGIGDTPYDIPSSATDKDHRPLMEKFENYLGAPAACGCVGATQTFTCGEAVTESCVFNCDMSCPTGHGLVVGGDDIVIDGAGYTIDGVSPGECVLDRAGIYGITFDIRDNVTIKNLKVKNFCSGIFLSGLLDGTKFTNVTIDNCTIYDNGVNATEKKTHGIKMIRVHDSIIENCKIYNNTGGTGCTPPCENGGSGIFLKIGNDNVITNNEIYDNKKGGFFCKASPKRCELSHNEVWGNHQGGIIVRCKCTQNTTIEYNNVSYNYGTGIFIGGPCNTIRHNKVCNNMNGAIEGLPDTGTNGCGVNFGRSDNSPGCGPGGSCGSRYNSLINNTICDNEYLDIWECQAGGMEPPVRGTNNGVENKCDKPDGWNDEGVTGCTYSCTAPAGICGDINEDEDVDMLDVIDVLYYVSYPGEYEIGSAWAVDVNCDTKIDMLDVIDMLYYVSYPGEYELGCCET